MSYHDTPTEPKILPLRNLETVIQIENLWSAILNGIEKIHTLEDETNNISLKVALAQVERAFYDASSALNRASTIARRTGDDSP